MTPAHDGTVSLDVWGQAVTLRFDWAALSRLRAAFGEGWADRIEAAFVEQDADAMALILAAGSDKPAAWWLEHSPPLVPAGAAARKALLAAFYGPALEPQPVDPPLAANKTHQSKIVMWFAALIARGVGSAATR